MKNFFFNRRSFFLGVRRAAAGGPPEADKLISAARRCPSSGIFVNRIDQETMLHYNYHRYYDPATGRYLRPDPIGLAGGINLYVYTLSNPINTVDIFGLEVSPTIGNDYFEPKPVIYYSRLQMAWTIMFVDYSKQVTSPEMDISVSETIIGSGIQFVFESNEEEWQNCPFNDLGITFGLGQYFGVNHQPKTGKTSFNLGLGLGPPINITYPLETVDVTK